MMERHAKARLPRAIGLSAMLAVSARPLCAQRIAVPADSMLGSIEGTVRGSFEGHLQALPWALVEALTHGVRRSTLTDSLGRYHLAGLPAGLVQVSVSHIGHAPVTMGVVVAPGTTVPLDVELAARPLQLPAIEVAQSRRVPDSLQATAEPQALATVESAALETGAGVAGAGIADAVRALQGGDPAKATDVLFMRGSTTDLKLVLLDGAPVYTPFHVAGLMSSFDPAVLGSADLHVGGAPARYDGGLSYILDLRTRAPRHDRLRGTGSVDLLSAAQELDGPIGKHVGFVASARALHDLGGSVLGGRSPYGYRDALLSTDVRLAPGHVLRTTGFWNRESVALDLARTQGIPAAVAPPSAWWSNRAVSGVYDGRVGRALLDVTAAAGGYRASLPLQPSATQGDPNPPLVLATADMSRVRLVAEVATPIDGGTARVGLSYDGLGVEYRAARLAATPVSAVARGDAADIGGYVDVTRSVGSQVTARLGLRADAFSGAAGGVRLAPRASIAWTIAPAAVVTVAAGRYHQVVGATDAVTQDAVVGSGGGQPVPGQMLPVASADHVVLSLDQTLGEDVRLGLEGFWKSYQGLQPGSAQTVRSSGVDVRVQHEGERSTVWLGYGLSWFWSTHDLSGATAEFVGRQILNAGVSGTLEGPIGGGLRVAYGAGLPYTAVTVNPTASPGSLELANGQDVATQTPLLPGGPDGAFLRVDVQIQATLRPRWGGRDWTIEPYLRVLNALDRRDALFYAFEPYRDDALRALAKEPLLPVLGVSWRF